MNDIGQATADLRADGFAVSDLRVLDDRHPDRPVLAAVLDGKPIVAKVFVGRDASSRAHAAHQLAVSLWRSPLGGMRSGPGIAAPIGWSPSAAAVLSELVEGAPLGSRGELGGALTHGAAAAELLADLHLVDVATVDPCLAPMRSTGKLLRSLRRKAAELAGAIGPAATDVVDALESTARPPLVSTITHGDFTPRNLLIDHDALRIIDFDRARLASPGRDVAYWRAWCWATELLHGAVPSWGVTLPFVEHYLAAAPAHRDEIERSQRMHLAAGLVRISHGWSALASLPNLQLRVVGEAAAIARGAVDVE